MPHQQSEHPIQSLPRRQKYGYNPKTLNIAQLASIISVIFIGVWVLAPTSANSATSSSSANLSSPAALNAPKANIDAPSAPAPNQIVARPIYNEAGDFNFCLAEFPYPNGRSLTLAASPLNELNIGLTIPQAGFIIGSKYDLSLSFLNNSSLQSPRATQPDAPASLQIRGIAVAEDSLLLKFGTEEKFAAQLASSKGIVTQASGTTLSFALPEIQTVLRSLQDCNKSNAGKHMDMTNFPETLGKLLNEAGLKGYKPISLNNVPLPQRPADFVWQIGEIMGGVRERNNTDKKPLEELAKLYIAGLKKKCAGTYSVSYNKEKTYDGLSTKSATFQCNFTDNTHAINSKELSQAILLYTTTGGKFTVFTHEGPPSALSEMLDYNNGIENELIKLATQNAQNQAKIHHN